MSKTITIVFEIFLNLAETSKNDLFNTFMVLKMLSFLVLRHGKKLFNTLMRFITEEADIIL